MAKQDSKKETKVKEDKKPQGKVSQSTDKVQFKVGKDHKGLKKDSVITLSVNIAETLERKGLGKQV